MAAVLGGKLAGYLVRRTAKRRWAGVLLRFEAPLDGM